MYGFRPDFCEAADPESKGIVENLVGYFHGQTGDFHTAIDTKGTDLRLSSAQHLVQVAAETNSRPRKSLNWDTPAERLAMLVAFGA